MRVCWGARVHAGLRGGMHLRLHTGVGVMVHAGMHARVLPGFGACLVAWSAG